MKRRLLDIAQGTCATFGIFIWPCAMDSPDRTIPVIGMFVSLGLLVILFRIDPDKYPRDGEDYYE